MGLWDKAVKLRLPTACVDARWMTDLDINRTCALNIHCFPDTAKNVLFDAQHVHKF